MAQKRKSGGGPFGPVIGFILVGIAVFTFLKLPGMDTPDGMASTLKQWSISLQNWYNEQLDNPPAWPTDAGNGGSNGSNPSNPIPADPGSPAPAPGDSGTNPADWKQGLLATVSVSEEDRSKKYNREDWKHWSTVRSCWDTRDEVLYRQAVSGSLVLLDKDKRETSDANNACSIKSGQWVDPYTAETFTDPGKLDIDHVIALGYAAYHGGNNWDSGRKEQFANSLEGNHLLAVSASANREKSDKGPGSWKPSNQGHHCQYAKDWISISTAWGLTVTQKDYDALSSMLDTCQ